MIVWIYIIIIYIIKNRELLPSRNCKIGGLRASSWVGGSGWRMGVCWLHELHDWRTLHILHVRSIRLLRKRKYGKGRNWLTKETRLHISIIVIAIYNVSENSSFIEIFQNWKYLIESLLMLKLIEKQLISVLLIQLSFSWSITFRNILLFYNLFYPILAINYKVLR